MTLYMLLYSCLMSCHMYHPGKYRVYLLAVLYLFEHDMCRSCDWDVLLGVSDGHNTRKMAPEVTVCFETAAGASTATASEDQLHSLLSQLNDAQAALDRL